MSRRLYRFKKFSHQAPEAFTRAHLEIYGIDHFRPSYDALVFFNDPEVTLENASEERDSCAGRFSIFGHATCYGSAGHCSIGSEQRRFDKRRSHPLTRAFKRVDVTRALRACIDAGDELEITIVAATGDEKNLQEVDGPLFSCAGLQLVTFA